VSKSTSTVQKPVVSRLAANPGFQKTLLMLCQKTRNTNGKCLGTGGYGRTCSAGSLA
jgi:hypothetical protein